MKEILRTDYLDWLYSWHDKPIIKVLTGIRRCGKSTLLRQFRQLLMEHGVSEEQIISINFEDMSNQSLMQAMALHTYLTERLQKGRMTYILLDEVQMVEEFQRAVNSIYLRPDVDIYITGSNAHLLSGELATLLSGRYIQLHIMPLSFKEYTQGMPYVQTRDYNTYTTTTSFPFLFRLSNDTEILQYLHDIYATVMMRDVVERNNIQDINVLNRVIAFMADNIGNLTNPKRIADTLTSAGTRISPHTVNTYLEALTNCYLFYPAQRIDVKGGEILRTGRKYYLADVGIRQVLVGSQHTDRGHILENVVFLELLRRHRNQQVYIGKAGDAEVDFVCQDGGQRVYYQVALTVREEKTLQRELAALHAISDSYPKFLLTLDEEPPIDHNGIRQLYVLDWLLGR
ncbi:MAG: ATP-binding protein [Paludibacteraceae bacterium]|nr:ATP-binding protein [Paludibacteraceae bacterium]